MPLVGQHCSRSKAPYPFIAVLITLGVGAGIGRVIPNVPPGNLTLALILLTALAPFLLIGCSITVGCRGHGLSQYWIWIFFAFWAVGFSAAGATYKDDSNNWILVIYYFIFYSVCLIDYMVIRGGCYWKRDRKCLAKGCANLSIAMYFGLFGAMMVAGMYGASIRNRNFSSHFAYDVSVNDLANTREKYGWTFRDGAVIYSQLNGTIRSLIDSSNQNVNKILFEYTCIAPVTADAQAADAGNTIAFWVVMRRNFTGQPQSGAVAVCNSLDLSLWSTPHLGALKVSSYNATTGLQLLSEYAPMLGATTLINDTLYTWTQDVEGRGVSTNTAFAIVGTIMSVLVFIAAINTICWFDTSLLVQDIPLDDALGLKRPAPAAAAATAVEEGAATRTDAAPATSPDAAPAAAAPSAGTAPAGATAPDVKPGDAARAEKEKEANGISPAAPATKFIHKIPATGKTAPAAPPSAAPTPAPAAVAAPPRLTNDAAAESDSSDVEGEKPPSYEDADGPPPSINDISGKADVTPAAADASVAPAISLLVLLPNGSKRLFTESLPTMAAVKAEMNTRFELGTTDFILEHFTEEFDEWVEIGHVRELPSRGRFRIRLGASGISGASASTTTTTAATTTTTASTTDVTSDVPTVKTSVAAATTSDTSRRADVKKEERPAVAPSPKAASRSADGKAFEVNDDMLLTQPRANTKRKEKDKGKGDDMSDSTHTDDGRV